MCAAPLHSCVLSKAAGGMDACDGSRVRAAPALHRRGRVLDFVRSAVGMRGVGLAAVLPPRVRRRRCWHRSSLQTIAPRTSARACRSSWPPWPRLGATWRSRRPRTRRAGSQTRPRECCTGQRVASAHAHSTRRPPYRSVRAPAVAVDLRRRHRRARRRRGAGRARAVHRGRGVAQHAAHGAILLQLRQREREGGCGS